MLTAPTMLFYPSLVCFLWCSAVFHCRDVSVCVSILLLVDTCLLLNYYEEGCYEHFCTNQCGCVRSFLFGIYVGMELLGHWVGRVTVSFSKRLCPFMRVLDTPYSEPHWPSRWVCSGISCDNSRLLSMHWNLVCCGAEAWLPCFIWLTLGLKLPQETNITETFCRWEKHRL